jgi:hypothetical protein
LFPWSCCLFSSPTILLSITQSLDYHKSCTLITLIHIRVCACVCVFFIFCRSSKGAGTSCWKYFDVTLIRLRHFLL